ncbi:MAG TPA: DNA-processing protein DprA [Vicinamibacterales bacterium]
MDLLDAVAVSVLPGISRTRAAAAFKVLRTESVETVTLEAVTAACGHVSDADSVAARARATAARLVKAGGREVQPVGIEDADYPPLLREIVDPPPVLWVRGARSALTRPAVAVVGSRAASPYALEVAMRLGRELAESGMVVVSGLARGADSAAHRGCLSASGSTVGVLGSGVDVVYPAEHTDLAANICRDGALVSELGPGAPPLPEHFPLRNRLISGISLAVVVVEAAEKSGSLITARYALEQGRDVCAVPGSVLGGRNRGSHALLKDGAKVVESADDILGELGWPGARAGREISGNTLKTGSLLDKLTPGEAYGLDELSATVGLTGSRLLSCLTEWELSGQLVKRGSLWQRRS